MSHSSHPRSAFILALALAATPPLQAQDPPLHEYGVFAATQDQVGEMFINGFPYRTADLSIGTSHTEIITRFLRKGGNEIVLQCTDQFAPGGEKKPGFCRFRLEERVAGGAVTPLFELDRQCNPDTEDATRRDEIYTLSTTDEGFSTENRSKLFARTTDYELDLATERVTFGWDQTGRAFSQSKVTLDLPNAPLDNLPWLTAPVVLDAAGETQIRDLIEALHQHFVDKDANMIVTKLAAKASRTAGAMNKTEAQINGILRDYYNQQVFSIANFALDPLDPAALTFVTYAGLNLVQAVVDGNPPIRAGGEGSSFSMKVFLSHLDGEWKIVE